MISLPLSGLSVMVAMPTHRDLDPQTVVSLMGTADLLRTKNIPFELQMQAGGSVVSFARSKAAHYFLESNKNRLFWVDSDIVWKPEDFLKLVALSSRLEVVGAMYPSKSDPPTFFINYDEGADVKTNEFGCIEVKGWGLGFTVVDRVVIEQLAERAPVRRFPDLDDPIPHIFRIDEDGEHVRGEDMAFFADIKALGYSTWVDPTIELGHIGRKTYTASLRQHLKEKDHGSSS
jgi:hypothetical protein